MGRRNTTVMIENTLLRASSLETGAGVLRDVQHGLTTGQTIYPYSF